MWRRFQASLILVFCLYRGGVLAQGPWLENATPAWNPGIWFEADAVYMTRTNAPAGSSVLSGPESFPVSTGNFQFEPGARLTLGLEEGDYALRLSFLALNDWSNQQSSTLTHGVDFDGSAAYDAASFAAKSAVDPTRNPNFLTTTTYFSPINTAANVSGETDALEFLKAGAAVSAHHTSNLQDLELIFSSRRDGERRVRWGIGYRNVRVRENAFASLGGTFGTVDVDGSSTPGNLGLANRSLTSTGLTLTSGTNNGFSDFIPATPAIPAVAEVKDMDGNVITPAVPAVPAMPAVPPDVLLFTSNTHTDNILNGVQAVLDVDLLQSEWIDLTAFSKAGIYQNYATGRVVETYADTLNDGSTYSRTPGTAQKRTSFITHLGVSSRLHVWQNVDILGGYEVMYITGLALAPDQLQGVGGGALHLRNNRDMLVHGGRLGIEVRFR